MSCKLLVGVPMAILLGVASIGPAAAQAGSHRFAHHMRVYSAYALAPAMTQSSAGCPTLEGYPDCHPNGRAPWTIYPTN
jgi:hypothetical protein